MEGITQIAKKEKIPQEIFADQFIHELKPKSIEDVDGKGMSQRDIADIIDDIYGFKLSPQQISIITDSVIEELTRWQERSLKKNTGESLFLISSMSSAWYTDNNSISASKSFEFNISMYSYNTFLACSTSLWVSPYLSSLIP